MADQRIQQKEIVRDMGKYDRYSPGSNSGRGGGGGKPIVVLAFGVMALVVGAVVYLLTASQQSVPATVDEPLEEAAVAQEAMPPQPVAGVRSDERVAEETADTRRSTTRDSVEDVVSSKMLEAIEKIEAQRKAVRQSGAPDEAKRTTDSSLATAKQQLQNLIDQKRPVRRRDPPTPQARTRSRAEIVRVVKGAMPGMRAEYARLLESAPDLQGKVYVQFGIDEHGSVCYANVKSSTTDDPRLDKAVVARVQRLKFPAVDVAGDTTRIVYPFSFNP